MEWLDLILKVLEVVGGSALLASVLPEKVRTAIPPVVKFVDMMGANFLNAKNEKS